MVKMQLRMCHNLDINVKDTDSFSLAPLRAIRDNTPPSSRNTSKGALVKETYAGFQAVRKGLSLGRYGWQY